MLAGSGTLVHVAHVVTGASDPAASSVHGARSTAGGSAVRGAAIRTVDIGRRFGDVDALRGLSIAVSGGEIYGFLGPNGAGKSTLVRVLCTLLRPTSGHAAVLGHDVVREKWEVRSRIGVALQDAALDERQTGRELLWLQGRLYGLRRSAIASRMSEVLDLVDIGAAIDRRISTYSGGMRRRLDLAAALVHSPEVLFLDEPTTGLDPHSRAAVWSEVGRLNRDLGMTIFLTTQYLEEADELADRVGIIASGRVVAEGSPGELKRSIGQDVIVATVDSVDEEALGAVASLEGVASVDVQALRSGGELTGETEIVMRSDEGSSVLSPLAVTLEKHGARVLSIVMRSPTLDDAFLQITGGHSPSASWTTPPSSAPSSSAPGSKSPAWNG